MSETKPQTFRLSEDAAAKFKQISDQFGYTQAQTFDNLLRVFELQDAKTHLPDQERQIDEFDAHAQRLVKLYIETLEQNRNMEDIIRDEFQKRLANSEATIIELREKNTLNQATIKDYEAKLKQKDDINATVEHQLDVTNGQNRTLNALVDEYKDKNDTLSGLLTEYKQYKDDVIDMRKLLEDKSDTLLELQSQVATLEKDNQGLQQTMDTMIKDNSAYIESLNQQHQQQLNDIKERHNNQLQLVKSQLAVEKRSEILAVKESLQSEIEALHKDYRQQIRDLLVELRNNDTDDDVDLI